MPAGGWPARPSAVRHNGGRVSTRPGFTARFVATQALSFGTPSGGAYGSVSSNGSSITVAASGSAGSTFPMQIPVNNQANSQVQYELRAIGLDFGRKSTVQGGDLTVWHGQARQAADLGRLIYGGAAWLEDGSGQRLPGSADGLFQGESNPNGGAANDVGVLSCVTGLSVSPENLAVPATCLTHSAVRSASRTDLLYVDGTGPQLAENRMTAPEGARALWLVTVEQEAGEAANTGGHPPAPRVEPARPASMAERRGLAGTDGMDARVQARGSLCRHCPAWYNRKHIRPAPPWTST